MKNNDSILTEYNALTDYANNVISHRLTIFGLFLPALAIVAAGLNGEKPSWLAHAFGLLITIAVYIFDLRARNLTHSLYERAIEIEQQLWAKADNKREPFISGLSPHGLSEILGTNVKKPNIYTRKQKIFGFFQLGGEWVTYSFALDLIYSASILLFSGLLFYDLILLVIDAPWIVRFILVIWRLTEVLRPFP